MVLAATLSAMKRRSNGATPALLRRINAGRVLDTLRRFDALRVIEIAGYTELSRPTVDAAVDDLVRLGLVVEVATDGSRQLLPRRGRPARQFAFRADAGHVLGVDIGIEQVYAIVADLRGDPVVEHRRTYVGPTGTLSRSDRLREIYTTIDIALRKARLGPGALRAAGIGTPGIVDSAAGGVRYCVAMPDWSDFPLASLLGDLLGCPIAVDNDANLAAVGEWWRGAARGSRDLIFFFHGEHAGAGIMVEDRVVRGHDGGAGELGFARLWEPTADPAADPVADPVTSAGKVLATMALLLAPELMVVAGRTGEQAPVDELRAMLKQLTGSMTTNPPRLEAAELGERTVVFGAIHQALALIEDELLDGLDR